MHEGHKWALNRAKEKLDTLPEWSRGAMIRYLEYGIDPGHFLRAVLANDLVGSFGQADEDNRREMFAYANFVYNYIPCAACGSRDAVDKWMATGGFNGFTKGEKA